MFFASHLIPRPFTYLSSYNSMNKGPKGIVWRMLLTETLIRHLCFSLRTFQTWNYFAIKYGELNFWRKLTCQYGEITTTSRNYQDAIFSRWFVREHDLLQMCLYIFSSCALSIYYLRSRIWIRMCISIHACVCVLESCIQWAITPRNALKYFIIFRTLRWGSAHNRHWMANPCEPSSVRIYIMWVCGRVVWWWPEISAERHQNVVRVSLSFAHWLGVTWCVADLCVRVARAPLIRINRLAIILHLYKSVVGTNRNRRRALRKSRCCAVVW